MRKCPICGQASNPCLIGDTGQFYCANCKVPTHPCRWPEVWPSETLPKSNAAVVCEPPKPDEEAKQADSIAEIEAPPVPAVPQATDADASSLTPYQLRCLRTLQEMDAGTEPGTWHDPADVFKYGRKRGFIAKDDHHLTVRSVLAKGGAFMELRAAEYNAQKFTCRVSPAWCGVDVAKVVYEMERENG